MVHISYHYRVSRVSPPPLPRDTFCSPYKRGNVNCGICRVGSHTSCFSWLHISEVQFGMVHTLYMVDIGSCYCYGP